MDPSPSYRLLTPVPRTPILSLIFPALALGVLYAPGGAGAKEPPVRQVRLVLPLDVRTLPKLSSDRYMIYAPQVRQTGERAEPAWTANTYHHNPIITWWRGRAYCAWTTSQQSEATPLGGLLASSDDGAEWSAAVQPEGWERFVPRGWHQTADRLYVWSTSVPSVVYQTADGKNWSRVAADAVRDVDFAPSNKKLLKLRDGRVMTFGMRNREAVFPITADPTGLTGWQGGKVDSSAAPEVGEPGGWEARDGSLHGTSRYGTSIWHTYSLDRGATWSKLAQQPGFPDNPGNKDFGALPNGWIWYVGNPKPGSRSELVLGISRDGWTFDRCYLVRWEPIRPVWYSRSKSEDRPGYEYPAAVYHDGALWITYSRTRDWIEICRVPVAKLLR